MQLAIFEWMLFTVNSIPSDQLLGLVYDLATLPTVNKFRNGQLDLFRSFPWEFKIESRKEIQISLDTRTVVLDVGESATICGL